MRLIRLSCLAALMAVAATAFIGAGSASAVTLCLKNEDPCSKENIKHLSFGLDGDVIAHLAKGNTDLCTHLAYHITVLSGSPAVRHYVLNSLTGCKQCESWTPSGSAGGTLSATGEGNGVLTETIKLVMSGCPLGLSCTYSGKTESKVLGSETNAKIEVAAKLALVEGTEAFCGSELLLEETIEGVSEEDKMTFVSAKP